MSETQNLEGAAEKISGLLNPQDQQETEIKKVEPSESEPEQQEVQESQAESEATNEQESKNTEVTEEQQTELEEPNLHQLKVNGQEIEVSLDELKAGYSRDSDYRQKTHSLSQERKSLEEQKNSLRQSYETRLKELNDTIATADEFIRQQQGGQDLQKLFDEDPVAAARLEFQLRQQSEKIEEMKSKAREAQHKQYNDFLETQKELAAQKIPEFADPSKADTFKINMRNTLRDYGFNDQEIGSLADHRFLMVAKDAMGYKSLQNKKPIVQKKVANAPKVVKSGVAKQNVSSGREVIRNKINKLRKSGSINDAKSALLDIINLKSQQRK
jgi:DNA repair exonuclease SbcCD ATPase subunit